MYSSKIREGTLFLWNSRMSVIDHRGNEAFYFVSKERAQLGSSCIVEAYVQVVDFQADDDDDDDESNWYKEK